MVRYTKAKILTMRRFCDRRDLLSAILKDTKTYTIAEVNNLMKNFMKGEVK